jgi:hypothetical protein
MLPSLMSLASAVFACLYFDSKVVCKQLLMEQHAGGMAIQLCRGVLLPSAERRLFLAPFVCILFESTTLGSCFYITNVNMSSCKQEAVEEIYMRGRSAKNKQRLVCGPCMDWFVEESLASIAMHEHTVASGATAVS